MKQIDRKQNKTYLPVCLYLDELSAIEKIINDAGGKPIIKIADCEFDSIADLVKNQSLLENNKLDEALITSRTPSIYIFLRKTWASLEIDTSDLISTGVFTKIDKILKSCKRRTAWINHTWWGLLLLFIISVSLFLILLFYFEIHFISKDILSILSPVQIAGITCLLYVIFYKINTTKIILQNRANAPSFFKRNKDQIIVNVIIAIIGAILGIFGTLIVSSVNK